MNRLRGISPHAFRQFAAAKQMKVDMLHRLASVLAAVRDDAVAVFQPLRLCDPRDGLKDRACCAAVFGCDGICGSKVLFGNDKNVNRGLRMDIPEGVDSVEDGHDFASNGAFEDCEYLRRAVIPSTLRRIASYMFEGCERLTEMILARPSR